MSITLADINQRNAALLWKVRQGLGNLERKKREALWDNLQDNGLNFDEINTVANSPPSGKYQPYDIEDNQARCNERLLESVARTLRALPEKEKHDIIKAMKLAPEQAASLDVKIGKAITKEMLDTALKPYIDPTDPVPPAPELPLERQNQMLKDVMRHIGPAGGMRPPLWFEENAPPPPMELPVDEIPKTDPLIPGEQTPNIPPLSRKTKQHKGVAV